MNIDNEISASRSELALQDLLIDVAAAVDATGCGRTSNMIIREDGSLRRMPDVSNNGNNLRRAAVWNDERI
jgi:hypothetical protein